MKAKSAFLFFALGIMILCGLNSIVLAKEVNITTAKNVALNLYTERSGLALKQAEISRIIEEKEHGETVYYIMVYSGKGFAIISAEDVVQPVLGYSFESNFDENNHSPAFEFYILKRLKKQIYAARQAQIIPAQETILEWQQLSAAPENFQAKGVESLWPLLKTLWGQGQYYNSLCPVDAVGPDGHALVGCVATAMAQVLNYWQHPWHGTGSHSYTPEAHPEYGVQFADFTNVIYNFDYMPDTVTDYSDDLAELMYHCAVSVDMDFGPDGSGASGWGSDDVSNALKNYFFFNDDAEDIERSSYSATWVDRMKENLDLNRPVIYGAEDNQEDVGHAWVLDAYTTGDMFHCNWGWSGSDNGWYSIDDFSVGGYTFDTYETACVNICPKAGHLSGILNFAGSPYYLDYDHYIDAGAELTIEPGVEVIFTGRYKLEVRGRLIAIGTGYSILFTSELPEIGMRGVRFSNTNNYSADSSIMVNCWFENGKGGYNNVLSPDILYGGAVYCENSSRVLLSDCEIKNSSATYGGGIGCYDTSNIRIKDCLITNDSAVMGGGIYLSYSDAVFSNNLIDGNKCSYSNGGGIYCDYSDATFYHDTIRNNTAQFGGGIGFAYSEAVLESVVIHDNEVNADGGGIYTMEAEIEMNNVQLYNNLAGGSGGAILCYMNSDMVLDHTLIHHNFANEGSAMAIYSANPELMNVTINYNGTDIDGEGIFISDGGISIENSILWDNYFDEIDTSGTCVVSTLYSIIEKGNWPGTGVIQQNPFFQSPGAFDYHLTWEDYPMPDGQKSGAIDTGNPASPPDSDGTRADMGVYPFEQVYTTVPGGNINGTLACSGSPYFIDGNLLVAATDELVIEPCVTLIFRGDYELKVLGRLQAEGTEDERVNFAPADTVTGWQGIRFTNTISNGLDSSRMVNCRITFGNANGGGDAYKRGGALFFSSSGNVRISNCLINKNKAVTQGGAVYIGGTAGPKFTANTFEYNEAPSGGTIFGVYTNINLADNTFQYNKADYGGAIYVHTSNFQTAGNIIRNNRAELFGGGIYLEAHGTCVFDPVNKSNIYLNYAGAAGLDLYFTGNVGTIKQIVVDTFTVQNVNEHFAYPLQNFNISLAHSMIEQANSDFYISMTGSDENSGTSLAEPLKTMYMACIKIMADAANPRTIFLADGTYSEGATGEIFPVNWRDYVSLKGAGINETTIYGEDKNQLLFCYDDNNFNIDSLTFQGGYGENGGAIHLENGSSPNISHVRIRDNFAFNDGGGIYCKNYSSPQISHVNISGNTVDRHGGGLMCYLYSDASMVNCMVADNFALYSGGGICASMYSDIQIDSLTIYNNTAVQGAGLNINWLSNGLISNTVIESNNAPSHVVGYFGAGGGVWIYYLSSPTFYNVEISQNHADSEGGGIYASSQTYSKFTNCLVEYNTANFGGGLYLYGNANHKYFNTIISNNSTTDYHGGGIYSTGANPVFTNVTITQNTANGTGQGGALYNYNSNSQFHNSILWDNSPNEIQIASGSVTAEYCDIEGSFAGMGNINSDPIFEVTLNGLFDLGENSPCINTGNPDTTGMSLPLFDFAGNLRIISDTVDMGAFEFQPSSVLQLDLKVFLEGPFNGTNMTTDLTSSTNFPLSQPYNVSPWNYNGLENVLIVPTNAVDWILVELRDAPGSGSATPETMIDRQAAFLMSDGSIRNLDGTGFEQFDVPAIQHALFAVVHHRNHLSIMSAYQLHETGGVYNYDFTTGAAQAYNNGQKEIAPGIWGMIAGDADASGLIDISDKSGIWQTQVGFNGYYPGDMNMDSEVDNSDKNDYWLPNTGAESQVPE